MSLVKLFPWLHIEHRDGVPSLDQVFSLCLLSSVDPLVMSGMGVGRHLIHWDATLMIGILPLQPLRGSTVRFHEGLLVI